MVMLNNPVYVTLRVIGNKAASDINKSLDAARGPVRRQGQTMGKSFADGFKRGTDTNIFSRVTNGLRAMVPQADAARAALQTMIRTGYTAGTAMSMLVGGVSAVIGGLVSLVGAAGGAAASLVVLGNAAFALGAGMIVARLALGGVGQALGKYNQQVGQTATVSNQTALQVVRDSQARANATKQIEAAERSLAKVISRNRELIVRANEDIRDAQLDLNKAIREGKEELQQIGFEAEDAALAERRAAIDLENARQALMRTQDLPPNSRARKEAEQAYLEAELNYRKAKDLSSDLNKEQDRLAKTGVDGLAGIIEARKRLAEAEQAKADAVKDAAEDEADALRDLEEAREDANNVEDRQEAAQMPSQPEISSPSLPGWDDGLNDAQRRFVEFLASIQPALDKLKEAAANSFLPLLQVAIQNLVDNLFPTLERGITIIGTAMGNAAVEISEIITESQNIEKLNKLFDSSGVIIGSLGTIFGRLYDIMLSIFVGAAPMAERFFAFLADKFTEFAAYLNTTEGQTALKDFFEDVEYTAKRFGDVLGNVFGSIGAIIEANIGPGTGGDKLLIWLEKATRPPEDGDKLKQYFLDVAENTEKALTAVGLLVDELVDLGTNQNIGTAFETLGEGADNLGNILQKMADGSPEFAELIVTLTEIVDIMTDTGALSTFFDVLNGIAGTIRDFISQPGVKAFMDFFGRIMAVFSAVGLAIGVFKFGINALVGSFLSVIGPIGKIGQALGSLGAIMKAHPIMTIVTIIAGIVTALVWFFTQTEVGKQIWEAFSSFVIGLWTNISSFATELFTNLGNFFTDLWNGISSVTTTVWNAVSGFFVGLWNGITSTITTVWNGIANFFRDTWNNVVGFFNAAWQWINNWVLIPLGNAINFVGTIFGNLGNFFRDTWNNIMGFFNAAWVWIDSYVLKPLGAAFEFLGQVFGNVGSFIVDVWKNLQAGIDAVWQFINQWIFKPISVAVEWLGDVFDTVVTAIISLWEGLKSGFKAVWDFLDIWVFSPLTAVVKAIQTTFENVVKAVGDAWKTLYNIVRVPVNAVIDFAFNNGIVPLWNGIADAFGMSDSKLPKVALLPEASFATGGVLPGYTPGRDVHRFYSPTGGILNLSGGEAIMRPEWVQQIGGPAAVERMNRQARGGGSSGGFGTSSGGGRSFFLGGVFDFLGDTWENLSGFVTDAATIIGDFMSDPMKAVDTHIVQGIIKPVKDSLGGGGFIDLLFSIPGSIGKAIGKAVMDTFGLGGETKRTMPDRDSGAGMGWQSMWATLSRVFPNATLNDALRPAGTQTAAGGLSYHALGRAIDTTASMEIFNWIKRAFPGSAELIYSPAGASQLRNGSPYYWGDPVRSMHWDHVHWALAKGGTVMPRPGGTIARVAEAGRAERVEPLDPNGLSQRDKAIMDRYMGNTQPGNVVINVYGAEGQDINALADKVSRRVSAEMRRGASS